MTAKKTMFVKPRVPGSIIRDPRTRVRLPDEGGRVPRNSFWLRRLRNDVVEIPRPKSKPEPTESPARPKRG